MNLEEYKLWNHLTFRTLSYKRNFDLININECFITEHTGTISEINIVDSLPPTIVGEYGYSVWDIGLANKFNVDVTKLIKKYRFEDTYSELLRLKKEKSFDFTKVNKLILIHNLVIHPKYKKRGVTDELIENFYREFHDDQNAIIALIKPLQDNEIDNEHFYNKNIIRIKQDLLDPNSYTDIKACEYYSLDDLKLKTDTETNELKLYALASKIGFTRIDDSYLFILLTNHVMNRMKTKLNDISEILAHGNE